MPLDHGSEETRVRLYQTIPDEDFKPGTADLAGCTACDRTWTLDEDGCGSIDTAVIACPFCGSTDTGPVYMPVGWAEGNLDA